MSERINYHEEIGEPVKFGEALTIVDHPGGMPINNEALLNMAIELGLPSSDIEGAKKAIAATGFTNRFSSHDPQEELNSDLAITKSVEIGSILLRSVMKNHGWNDGIDVFIDTSAFLPTTINKEVLAKTGLNPNKVMSRSYRYACAGAIGAFIDCLSDPALQDARIVIGALEPLSYLIDRTQFLSPKNLSVPSIFGDANTFIAFTPKRFRLDVKQVLIQPDNGVIKLNTLYNFDQTPSEVDSIPSHYRFGNNGQSIFHYSKTGAYLDIEPSDNGSPISMDGMKTGFFFGDQTTSVIVDMLMENGDPDLLKKLGSKNIIMHPASKPVVDRIAKLLWRGHYRHLDSPHLPFLMDLAGHSNGSSATTLNRWKYMIRHNLLDPNLPMLWIAPGIGSAIAGAIGYIKP